jgi:IclR family mhp operon transcriptional activator
MVVIETNRPMSYFNYILAAPIGFRINMLRSASGRSYLAFCSQKERAAILARLRNSSRPGDALARSPAKISQILAETRKRRYGTRDPDFGGHYDQPRSRIDDGRNSIAVPLHVGEEIVGCINLTWVAKVATVKVIAEHCLPQLGDAARTIGSRMLA